MVGILLAIILTRLLILMLGKAAGGEVLPEAVLGLIAFGVLTYMPVLLGIGVFVAVLLALTRSYRDSEMTVWFTSGLSLAAWVKPVLQFAFPVAVICAVLSLVISAVVPGAERGVPAPAREPRRCFQRDAWRVPGIARTPTACSSWTRCPSATRW